MLIIIHIEQVNQGWHHESRWSHPLLLQRMTNSEGRRALVALRWSWKVYLDSRAWLRCCIRIRVRLNAWFYSHLLRTLTSMYLVPWQPTCGIAAWPPATRTSQTHLNMVNCEMCWLELSRVFERTYAFFIYDKFHSYNDRREAHCGYLKSWQILLRNAAIRRWTNRSRDEADAHQTNFAMWLSSASV